MKTIWTIFCVLALANLLGMAGFVGWLVTSDRLNEDRARRVRELLTPTITEEKAKIATEEETAKVAAVNAKEEERMAGPPESATELLERNRASDDVAKQTALRLRREIEDLRRQMIGERAKIDDERKVFMAEKTAFEKMRENLAKTEGAEQFKQALGTLESQKAKDAQAVLQTMLDVKQQSQVVDYLAAMQERVRSKIMAEFVKSDPKLAGDLLERLRLHGVGVSPSPAPPVAP